MNLNYLFPHRFKKIGWAVMIPTLIAGISIMYFDYTPEFFKLNVFVFWFGFPFQDDKFFEFAELNIFPSLIGILLILSTLLVAFSRQKEEDEFIAKIRLESLVWATYVNYAVLLIAMIFVFGFPFFNVMTFNLFTLLFFFIIRFNWELMKLKKAQKNEE